MTKRYKSSNKSSDANTKAYIEKQIIRAKDGNSSRSQAINNANLERFEKKLKSFYKGNVNSASSDDGYVSSKNGTSSKSAGASGIQENILHKFASYNTLFTLSGLKEEELQDQTFLTNPVHDVIARSGGIGNPNVSGFPASADASVAGDQDDTGSVQDREAEAERIRKGFGNSIDVLKAGRDIFFEEVNLLSTVGPSEERGLADFVKMDFKLHEPFGISFVEKMRAAARLNDYRDHLDAPMLLTIEFKGFDENGRPVPQYGTVRKIPILITRVDLDVNEGGAIYDVQAVRINDMAFDDRFKFPRCEITIDASTLAGAGAQLEKQLNEQIVKEKEEHKVRDVLDEYRIEFDDDVLALSKGFVGPKSVQNTPKGPPGGNRTSIEIEVAEAQVSNLTSLTKLIEDMVRSTKGYEDLATDFWTTVLRRSGVIGAREDASDEALKKVLGGEELDTLITKNPYVDWFKIKTSVQTDYSQFDDINKMHRKIITYKVIPYKIHVLKFMRPGVFMKATAAKQAVQKQYNYLYTGDNTDIQNLRINYKTAYYMRNTIEVSKASSGVFEIVDNAITRVFGKEDPFNNDLTAVRGYPSIVKGRSVVNKETPNRGVEARKQDFYDYLTNPTVDMMRIEMTILGDPAYICQDQFIPLNAQAEARSSGDIFDPVSGSYNADYSSPLMELVYRLPDDINDKTGLTFDKNSIKPEENLFFAGVYQIVKIESSISNGQFLQTLTCVRLNNQEGLGEGADIITQASNKLTSVGLKDGEPNTYVKDQLEKQAREKLNENIGKAINNIKDYF